VAVALWCLVVVALPATAADARGQAIEQQRLLNLKFDEQDRRCRQQFVVTACVDDVRRQRRDAVAPWREKELAAADDLRQQRAAQRQREISSKQSAAAANAAVSASANAASGASAPARAQPRASSPTQALPTRQGAAAPDSQSLASREALRRVQAAAKRQQQADVDAARINKLKAEQAARGKAAAPLPVPGAAGAN